MKFEFDETELELLADIIYLGRHVLLASAADYKKIKKYDEFYETFESFYGSFPDDWNRAAHFTNKLTPFIETYDNAAFRTKFSEKINTLKKKD